MKNCVYLVQNRTTGKWYIGSHKDSDNIRNRSYMGSGADLKADQELLGVDNFHIEVLVDFLDIRQAAYDVEDQILNSIDAAGAENSYNKKNGSDAPPQGRFTGFFTKKVTISEAQMNNIRSRVNMAPKGTSGTSVIETKITWEKMMEKEQANVADHAYLKGRKSGVLGNLDNDFDIIQTKLTVWLDQEISDLQTDINDLNKKQEDAGDIPIPELAKKLQVNNGKLEYLVSELDKVNDETGRFKMLKKIFEEHYREGVKKTIIEAL